MVGTAPHIALERVIMASCLVCGVVWMTPEAISTICSKIGCSISFLIMGDWAAARFDRPKRMSLATLRDDLVR